MTIVPSGPASAPSPQHHPLRVMSANLRYATAPDGPNAWPHRRALLARAVSRFGPDLLATQECLWIQHAYLLEHLPAYAWHGAGRDDGEQQGEMVAIYYRPERFHLCDAGHFWLSETPHAPGSRSWDTSLPRMASWLILKDRHPPGLPFLLINTHLDVKGPLAREQGARQIRHWADRQAPSGRVLLMGDFNARPGSPPYTLLTRGIRPGDAPWSDACLLAHERQGRPAATLPGTRHDFTGRQDLPRIDWILASHHFDIINAAIDTTSEAGRFPSDHFPVTAVLRLNESSPDHR